MTNSIALQYQFPAAYGGGVGGRDRLAERLSTSHGAILFLLFHIALALVCAQYPLIATAYAMGTIALGSYWAMQGRVMRVVWIAAYIAAAEVLWRMSKAIIFWEFGKYAIILVFFISLVRQRFVRLPWLALAYFLLLVPAIPFAFGEAGVNEARQQVSFNLSGPLCLFVSAWFLNHVRMDRYQVQVLLLVLTGPLIGIGANAAFSTVTAENLVFYGQSNVATSGGFGPNQVSSAMGLGIAAGLIWFQLTRGEGLLKRLLMLVLTLLLVVQTGLTFSRSGLGLAAVTFIAAAFYMIRSARTRVALLMSLAVIFVFVQFAMVPMLDEFTGGAFTQRFTDPSTTGRIDLAVMDLEIWQDNLLVGVGPGQATPLRTQMGHFGAAHTEFTRVLAEHGTLGLLSTLVLLLLVTVNFLRARGSANRGIVAAFAVYGVAFMFVNAFRVAAPALAIGLTCATYTLDRVGAGSPLPRGPGRRASGVRAR